VDDERHQDAGEREARLIDKNLLGNFTLDLPEPAIRQRVAPADFRAMDDYPELTGYVAFDTETDDPGIANGTGSSWARLGEGCVCGFSVTYGPHPGLFQSFYVGLHHAGGNSDYDKAIRWLRKQAAKPDVTFVYANAIYDLGWLRRLGIEPANFPIDVQGMAALLDAERYTYSLDSLMWDYLKERKSTDGLHARAREYGITNPYLHMKRLPTWDVAPYGIDDAEGTLKLFYAMLPEMEKQGLMKVFELERECILIGLDLRWTGIKVDQDQLDIVHTTFEKRKQDGIDEIKRITGVEISPHDTTAIARALEAETPSIQLERNSKGVPSVRVGILDALGTPVSSLIRSVRKYDKAIGTTVLGLKKFIAPDGRVHAEFHPLRKSRDEEKGEGAGLQGVGPGRFSSSSPNLQNIPRRDPEVGVPVRECFLAEDEEDWAKLDYSSQEPRGATHFAALINLVDPIWAKKPWDGGRGLYLGRMHGAWEMVERYRENPTLSMHKYAAAKMGMDAKGPMYDKIKILNLGIIYGMQGKKFCNENGFPTKWITTKSGREIEVAGEEGQRFLDKHYEAMPFLKDAFEVAKWIAEDNGYIKTFLGRRMRFNKKTPEGKRMFTYRAFNNAVQGTAADQMKMALCHMRRAGINVLVPVHDDANMSVPRGEAGQRRLRETEEIMAHAIELLVPSLAETDVGRDWGDVSKPKNDAGERIHIHSLRQRS
jgi:DNA polymerase I-like protein with 3'-5' exonuclease and polymerase domains